MRTVKLYAGEREDFACNCDCIAIVKYVENLDTWDGRNMGSGSIGHHIGVRKIEHGSYAGKWYVCRGSDWQGSTNEAFLITEDEAKQLCMNTNHDKYEELFGVKLEVF